VVARVFAELELVGVDLSDDAAVVAQSAEADVFADCVLNQSFLRDARRVVGNLDKNVFAVADVNAFDVVGVEVDFENISRDFFGIGVVVVLDVFEAGNGVRRACRSTENHERCTTFFVAVGAVVTDQEVVAAVAVEGSIT
ncbi:hypothetical protein DCD76_18810, partial [Acinetobacter baumannii]